MRKKQAKDIETTGMVDLVVKGMQEKKATGIAIVDMQGIKNSIADYFIICNGNSGNQVDAIADSVEEEIFKVTNQNPWHKEGKENKEWILIDYIDVIAHIFQQEKREFYGLEDLWGDAKITYVKDLD